MKEKEKLSPEKQKMLQAVVNFEKHWVKKPLNYLRRNEGLPEAPEEKK